MTEDLPFVDEHRIRIDAPRDLVWAALRRYVSSSLGVADSHPLGAVLGTEPRGGFAETQVVEGQRLGMAGRHRFSRYLLRFDLADAPDATTILTARTYAVFPGLHGRVYRALVIGTRAHVYAVRRMLIGVRRLSVQPAQA